MDVVVGEGNATVELAGLAVGTAVLVAVGNLLAEGAGDPHDRGNR